MKNERDAVIVAYGRSPLAKAKKGSFRLTHPVDYAAQTLRGVLERVPQIQSEMIDDVMAGCAFPEKYCGFNVGRLIARRSGLPDSVPGVTVSRFCASGLQAIASAANAIMADQADIIVAGGVELMTGLHGDLPEEYQEKTLAATDEGTYMPMGLTAENVAAEYHISRNEMDQMAVESHAKAYRAQKNGWFDEEIIPVMATFEDGEKRLITKDEGIRPSTNMETLATLKPCFKEDGIVTAATSSQTTDGAGFVIVMSREKAENLGIRPIAKLVSFAVAGVPSRVMGLGPMKAVPKVMQRSGLSIDDMDVIELNEAFASQSLACIQKLNLPKEKVNPNGGALALGHPLGATGAVLTCKALSECKRRQGKFALVTMCIAGGMGAAGIFEMEQE